MALFALMADLFHQTNSMVGVTTGQVLLRNPRWRSAAVCVMVQLDETAARVFLLSMLFFSFYFVVQISMEAGLFSRSFEATTIDEKNLMIAMFGNYTIRQSDRKGIILQKKT